MNIGLIGCGGVVTGMHLPALVSLPGVTIRWVCDSSLDRARQVARNWDVKEAFAQIDDCTEVDAVLVATPVGTRTAILAKVTERGWHALCEKPFASSTDDHCQILDGAGRSGLKLGAGYMRRYYWAVEQAREMLRTNVLGQLIEILASEPASLDRTGLDQSSYRNSTSASGGGVLFETGCHLLDEVMSVSDAERVDLHSCEQKIWNDYEVETVASGILTRGTGEEVALQFIVSGVRPVYQGITFRCEGGKICLRLDPSKSLEMYIGPSQHQLEIRHPNPQQKHLLVAFRREWLDFLEACQSGSDWDQNKMTGLLTTQVIMQCGDLTRESPKRSFSAVNR